MNMTKVGLMAGMMLLTALTVSGSASAACTVTESFGPPTYTVTLDATKPFQPAFGGGPGSSVSVLGCADNIVRYIKVDMAW